MDSSARDRGIVERPMLAPHLRFAPAGDGAALLVSEDYNRVLEGPIWLDLAPLLDGTRSRAEIAAALAGRHAALAVQTALVALAAQGLVVSAEFSMDRAAAAFWSRLGVSPRLAEERLGAGRVSVSGLEPHADNFARRLKAAGLTVTGEAPTLAVTVAPDFLDDALAGDNRRRVAGGPPWLALAPDGAPPLFGPVFRPGGDGPCLACLTQRLSANREADEFLRAAGDSRGAVRPRAPGGFVDAALGLAATAVAVWTVLGERSPLHRCAVSLDAAGLESRRHPVTRRPQCPVCGDPRLRRADREPAPVRLRPSPAPAHEDGGSRAVPPDETLRRWGHLADPVSGVAAAFGPIAPPDDPWLHVFRSSGNSALRTHDMRQRLHSLRAWCLGKGATAAQAQASALCEAVERRCGTFHGDEIRRRARFVDFPAGDALAPNDIQLFSDRQLADADALNAAEPHFNRVPPRFDPQAEMDWSPVWSLTQGRRRWLPTQLLWFAAPAEDGAARWTADSNGCAAGNTLEEAVLQGFLELVERDAFACWWYNRAALPGADPGGFGDPWLAEAPARYRARRRDMWLLDATHDLGVPVFVAVSRRTDKQAEDIIYAAGAHLDPRVAARRAVSELNQYLAVTGGATADGSGYLSDDAESLQRWRTMRLADEPWLAPAPAAPPRAAPEPVADATDTLRAIEQCRAAVESRGMEVLALDQTRPDIGLPVARTIVPGLRHFWPRFAPGRLYDVPTAMGWRDAPAREEELNPIPVEI